MEGGEIHDQEGSDRINTRVDEPPDDVLEPHQSRANTLQEDASGTNDDKNTAGPRSDNAERTENLDNDLAMTSISDKDDDDNTDVGSSDKDSNDDMSELIRLASAAAVRDAARMKRSDSDLSIDDDDILEELLEEDIHIQQKQNGVYPRAASKSRLSLKYMEHASYEASLVEDSTSGEADPKQRRTQLKPSGSMGRIGHRKSSHGIININEIEFGMDSAGDGENSKNTSAMMNKTPEHEDGIKSVPRRSEFGSFQALKSISDLNVYRESDVDIGDNDKDDKHISQDQQQKVVKEDNSSQSACIETATLETLPQNLLLSELLTKCGMDTTKYEENRDAKEDHEVLYLHALFGGFCRPRLELDSVEKVVLSERCRRRKGSTNNGSEIVVEEGHEFRVDLPVGVVIQRPSDVLINLLTGRFPSSRNSYLESLPPVFASSLFRILLRLLEGYTDPQYDSCVILASCPWQNDPPTIDLDHDKNPTPRNLSSLDEASTASPAKSLALSDEKLFVGTTNDGTANANLMYSIVRLRMKWQNSVNSMLLSLTSILTNQQEQGEDKSHLVFPMIRLVGLLCAGGVAVDELRRMISISSDSKISMKVKLLMARALSAAASIAAPTTITPCSLSSQLVVLGKAKPLNFFSFASGPGITRTIQLDDQQQATWPFRNDFGAAFNFRVEDFSLPSAAVNSGNSFILLQALSETGSGIEISLVPLPPQRKTTKEDDSSQSTAAVLSIRTIENHKTIARTIVNNCPLYARVWYHVAVRHTRSRLKGVFSLSSKEQLTVLLDGKLMLTESMKFPQVKHSLSSKHTLSFHVGKNLDGQVGSVYIFRDNVSDSTFKALFEETSSETTASVNAGKVVSPKRTSTKGGEVKDQSYQTEDMLMISSKSVKLDDLEHIAFGHICRSSIEEGNMMHDVADLHENEEKSVADNPLSKSSFISKLYISWNPRRKEKNFLMELHSGAHISLEPEFVQSVCIENAQQVISSMGGIQNLLSIFQSILGDKSVETTNKNDTLLNDNLAVYSLIPDLLNLLSCFVRGNYQNARELLRCGGVDIIQKLLLENKIKCLSSTAYKKYALIRSLFMFPTLSKFLVQTLLELRSSSSHYIPLEKKIFSALLFSIPLWLEWRTQDCGVALYPVLLPVLSYAVQDNPAKVRDLIGAIGMLSYITDILEMTGNDENEKSNHPFQRDSRERNGLTKLTSQERHCILNTLLSWIFRIFLIGPSRDDVSALIHLLSNYLELEWNESAKEVSEGNKSTEKNMHRQQRQIVLQQLCTIFYYSIELNSRYVIEDFAGSCGSIDGGVAWILSSLVNSYCDLIRSIGIRCVSAYMRATAHGPDLTLSLSPEHASLLDTSKMMLNMSGTFQENTISLISNVGHGLLKTNDKKEKSTPRISTQPKFTPRVIYKLLWHLLKSHRYRMGDYTQAALVAMVFENKNVFRSRTDLSETLIINDSSSLHMMKLDFDRVKSMMAESSVTKNDCVCDAPSMNTILRALRFLPKKYSGRWLSWLVELCRDNHQATSTIAKHTDNHQATSTIAKHTDWQPCLFQFISEIIENVAPTSSEDAKRDELELQDGILRQGFLTKGSNNEFHLSLELYSILLGYTIRNNVEKSIATLEAAAALQRVYVNGPEVFALILSHIIANLSQSGIVSLDFPPTTTKEGLGEPNRLLKYHAKMVTDAILSNGSRGMKLSMAVACWKFLKYLMVLTTAFVTSPKPDEEFLVHEKKDPVTNGIFGVHLPEGMINAFEYESILKVYTQNGVDEGNTTSEPFVHENLLRRLSVQIAAQILSLVDIFIFPEDASLDIKSSQMQGLSLVRGTEKHIGSAQGPLLVSLIRDSLLLLCKLEPCSVKMLQCCSRLRCFVHYSLELVRETDAMERYSGAFNKIALPFDRLLLSSFIRCHFALQKCAKLLHEIEYDSSSPNPLYLNKEERKKSYRRIFLVTIELRDIVMTIFEGRNIVLRNSLTKEAIVAFQSCTDTSGTQNSETSRKSLSQKESIVRSLLASDWVQKFEMRLSRGNDSVSLLVDTPFSILTDEKSFTQDLARDSSEIEKSFQKSLNSAFEEYLEKQRKWADTGAVRDLEFEGDTLLTTLSGMYKSDRKTLSKDLAELSTTANLHWRAIEDKSRHICELPLHWKLSTFTDNCGRRILLVPNLAYDSHESSRYDSMTGQGHEPEEKENKERMLQSELSDLMKRNAEALTSYDEILALEDDNDDERKEDCDKKEEDESFLHPETEFSPDTLPIEPPTIEATKNELSTEEINNDGDEWAKAFVWGDEESIVARFEEVMVVTLRYTFEGSLLLTTEGLYFHQIGSGTNVISKQPCSLQKGDRRWRLSGLKEVHGRRYMLRTQAIELFFANGHELFLNFLKGQKERNKFYAKLRNSCKVPMIFSPKSLNPRVVFKKTKMTEMWKKRKISNFDYLMALNRMAGRTFNDISQYPVFPWILNDYESDKIDLSDSRVYRDLSKPVGALNPDRLAVLIERYKELESFGFPPEEKFLYGSHYSSPGLILHFLIRQEPFTSMAIDLQSGKFDCPDRLFFDLKESWKSCNTSSSDVKELIPEFFTVPEIFQNSNHYPLGTTQKGVNIDNVGLPPWAKGSAYEFVRVHRLALESEYVSCNLQNWIDLVFGYKQRGLEAEKAWNVFHFLSYEGSVDLDKMKDDVDRIAAESHIQNFGQTPSQLLMKSPHPCRYGIELSWKPLINNIATAVRLRCHTPSQQFGGKSGRGAGAAVHIHIKADALIAVYSDLKIGFFGWSPKSPKNRLRPDRLQSLPGRNLSYSRSVMKRGSAVPQTVGERTSSFAVGNWSFAMSIGGYEKEQLRRRNTVVHSRLASAKDALYTDAAPLLVSCGYWDNTIKVHSTDGWRLESSDNGGHRGAIRCIAMGADGGMLVTGGEDCTCRVWVLDHPELAAVLSDGYMQTALGRQPNENQVLTCCHVLVGHESAISCVALSSELDIVVSGSIGGKICIHKLRTGEYVRSFEPSTSKLKKSSNQQAVPVTKIVLDEYGRMVIHTGDYRLYTYTANGAYLCSVNAGEQIHDMKITGEVVVTGGENGHVYIRNLATLKILSGMNLSKHGPIRCINFTPEDLNPLPQFLFIGSDDGMISIVQQNP